MTALQSRTAEPRNGRSFIPYRWRAPRPGWMTRALELAEAEHGPPVPTCVCGAPLHLSNEGYATCVCGYKTGLRHEPKAASMP